MKKIAVAVALSAFGSVAMADQCAVVTAEQAAQAVEIIQAATTVEHMCEPCGENRPTQLSVRNVDLQTFSGVGSGQYSVLINGKSADLAYTYVNGYNVAYMVGCPTQGVSMTIER
ncbi:MAG: hypothetical protein AB7G93_07630 [Bdellovibrionales bacterium]